jgi:16S rRNA processing protein RimM
MKLPGGEIRLVPFRNEFFGEVDPEKHRAILLEEWILE